MEALVRKLFVSNCLQRRSAAQNGWCPGPELNRHAPFEARDFKSRASASFATRARVAKRMLARHLRNHLGSNLKWIVSAGCLLHLQGRLDGADAAADVVAHDETHVVIAGRNFQMTGVGEPFLAELRDLFGGEVSVHLLV